MILAIKNKIPFRWFLVYQKWDFIFFIFSFS
jgi:hypothetical protein